jgi:hypothetical protein
MNNLIWKLYIICDTNSFTNGIRTQNARGSERGHVTSPMWVVAEASDGGRGYDDLCPGT